ncbi:MAG: SDR family NAD(P)-dependent oxidoreductase [Lachnospiraceae bacterium]|nr:SDR family NAD(P)-dependent oxidoreductase [Lachnospiraceae bacterium]
MSDIVMVTGTGRSYALGYNLVLRYLEAGDTVIATIRKPSPDMDALTEKYGDRLIVATMDLLDTASITAAAEAVSGRVDHIDILINNAVGVAPDVDKGFFDANLDHIPRTLDLISVGTLRVIKAFYPLLVRSAGTALIMNISSEAGSIEKCYRTTGMDYGMGKAALNMATMYLYNTFKDEKKVNIFAVHPGWIRTNGKDDNPAPLSSYEAAGILKDLFAERREDFTGHRFITNEGKDYPF